VEALKHQQKQIDELKALLHPWAHFDKYI
jgi:hypothetical protein